MQKIQKPRNSFDRPHVVKNLTHTILEGAKDAMLYYAVKKKEKKEKNKRKKNCGVLYRR